MGKSFKFKASLFTVMVALIFAVYIGFIYDQGANDRVTIHFIDVGQGDATLIQAPKGTVLIDGGDRRTSDALIRYLRSVGVTDITYVIATHPHSDHIGGLSYVINEFNVENIMMPKVAHNTVTFENLLTSIENNNLQIQEPIVNNTFNIGDVQFKVIAPNSSGYRNLNNYSIVLKMTYKNTSFLFAADAEAISENEILANQDDISANVLRVGHHGSSTSTTQQFLDAVSPQVAVISVGANNGYGHPSSSVINKLEEARVAIYRTDMQGTIVMSTDGYSIVIH